jgi:protein-disulfide isomerase
VPGVDVGALPGPARATLAAVLSDEFCHCGCPHTVGQCLQTHACRHAGRMARFAAREAAAGASAADISLALGRHYAGYPAARARLSPDPRMCTGPADAPVTLVEFSDFECPYCALARPLLEAFAKKHADRVRFCSLPFPLASHPNAVPAGEAVLFARDQGRFWAMHDALFEHQADLGPAALPAVARGAGLDEKALGAALKAGRYREELEGFKEQGRKAGVDSTPSLFLNGRRYALPLEEAGLEQALEEELEWQANHGAWTADD